MDFGWDLAQECWDEQTAQEQHPWFWHGCWNQVFLSFFFSFLKEHFGEWVSNYYQTMFKSACCEERCGIPVTLSHNNTPALTDSFLHCFSKRQASRYCSQQGRQFLLIHTPPTASVLRSALAVVAPTVVVLMPKRPQPDRLVWNRWLSVKATVQPSHCPGNFLHGPTEKYWGNACLDVWMSL